MLLLEQSQGNTGVAGLWQFDFRDGEVVDPSDQFTGGGGSDEIRAGEGNDTIFGLAGEDVLYGNQDDDVIYGNQDYDILFGGRGNDTLYGGQDGDILVGGVQNDVFYGNQGPDTMFGQGGADVFFIGPDIDLIPDFNPALDRVDVLDDIGLPEKFNLLRPTLDGDTFVFYKGGGVILQGLAFEDATIDIFL
ncbi:MAG: hypothetical protein KI792_09265 [Alphaproteobacteria bacterium]|nr:hypothetical protein [Alphaproteobacteria bacterium SS10]